MFICNFCEKKIDCGKQLNMTLREHITDNKSNFKFVPILNKIEQCLIAPLFRTNIPTKRVWTIWNAWKHC
jgi:hypothetical protein